MIAAASLVRAHRRVSRLLPTEHLASNEERTLAVRGVSQVTRSRSTPVKSTVVAGTRMGGGRE
jgi:hypothetical protein